MVGAHCTASTVADNRNIIDNLGKSGGIDLEVMVKNTYRCVILQRGFKSFNIIDALATCTYFRLLEIGI